MQRNKKDNLSRKHRSKLSALIKAAVSCLLVPAMILAFTACSPSASSDQSTSTTTTDQSNSTDTRTITDMAGRQVEIPNTVKTIAYTYGVAGTVLFTFGAEDMIAGVQGSNSFFEMLYPQIANVPQVGKGQADLEALAAVHPDIYIGRADNPDDLNAVQALGIPAIGIRAESLDDIAQLYTLMGDIIGQPDKATQLINFYNSINDQATSLVSGIPDSQKVTAILMGSDIGAIAHAEMIQSKMIVNAGGISCVVGSDVPTDQGIWPVVGTETIFGWNPDFIFLTNSQSATYTADDLLNDPAWANVQAVKDGHVYKVPSDMDSWEFPGLATSLGTLWMVSKMYPDTISQADFDQVVVNYYKTIYGIDVTPEEMGY